jgi:hypothetical protein
MDQGIASVSVSVALLFFLIVVLRFEIWTDANQVRARYPTERFQVLP